MKKNRLFFGMLGILICVIGTPSCAPDYETEFEVKTLSVPDRDLAPILFGLEGGQKEVRVETNVNTENWKVTSNADWCKVAKSADKVVISAAASELYVTRIAQVTIAYGHQSYDIPVRQIGKESILLVEGKRNGVIKEMAEMGGTLSVNVSSNLVIDYVSIPDTTQWVRFLSVTEIPGNATEKLLTFEIDPSFDSSIRYSTIILQSSLNFDYVTTFVIKQKNVEYTQVPLSESMLSTNAQEPNEGPIRNLIDNNPSTFFHSAWSVTISEAHYLQVTLENPINLFKFWYQNRNNSNGKPIDITIKISMDGSNWTDLTQITSGLPTGASSQYESELLRSSTSFKYIRWVVNKTNSGTAPTFFNMAEFKLYVLKQ